MVFTNLCKVSLLFKLLVRFQEINANINAEFPVKSSPAI
jgi:hypothetical protein